MNHPSKLLFRPALNAIGKNAAQHRHQHRHLDKRTVRKADHRTVPHETSWKVGASIGFLVNGMFCDADQHVHAVIHHKLSLLKFIEFSKLPFLSHSHLGNVFFYTQGKYPPKRLDPQTHKSLCLGAFGIR